MMIKSRSRCSVNTRVGVGASMVANERTSERAHVRANERTNVRDERRAGVRAGALTICALALAACGGGDGFVSDPPPPPATVSISINAGAGTVNVGATLQMPVTITGGSPTPTLASCSSSASATATVAASASACVVTGVAAGTATITATSSGGHTASASVTVAPLPPAITALTLTPATHSMFVGQTVPLVATPVNPAGATVSITYSSNNTSVASVSAAGVVTGVSAGTATITASAQGSGAGFTTTTIARTSEITISVNPCTPITVTLPLTRPGTVTANSCVLSTNVQRRGDVFRLTLPQASALELRLTPSGFAPYMSAFPAGEQDFIFSSRATAEEDRRIWHLPAGLTELRVGAVNAGQTGTYILQAATVSGAVENCVAVIIGGSVASTQTLSGTDCRDGGFAYDEFYVFSSRSCEITMTRSASGGVVDPYLEILAGSTLVAENDDDGGNGNARITLLNCRSPNNEVLTIRATSFDPFDFGGYIISVTIGAPAIGSAQGETFSAMQVLPKRTQRMRGAAHAASAWLDMIGVEVLSPAR